MFNTQNASNSAAPSGKWARSLKNFSKSRISWAASTGSTLSFSRRTCSTISCAALFASAVRSATRSAMVDFRILPLKSSARRLIASSRCIGSAMPATASISALSSSPLSSSRLNSFRSPWSSSKDKGRPLLSITAAPHSYGFSSPAALQYADSSNRQQSSVGGNADQQLSATVPTGPTSRSKAPRS